ncbi:MAG: formate dehydrogenase accessory protein FdhE [Syntrophobacteraceae bacterium]
MKVNGDPNMEKDEIRRAVALARDQRPAYSYLYDFLEALFLASAEIRSRLRIEIPFIENIFAKTMWESGLPLLNRWDFPIDTAAAEDLLISIEKAIPEANPQLANAYESLKHSIAAHSKRSREFWNSFLHHEMEPWEEWLDIDSATDLASVLFLVRSATKPSLELTSRRLLETHILPPSWIKGYCPVCGSLPALLYIHGEGTRKAFCSWCATMWDIQRLQCPYCENRDHTSLGYIGIDEEPQNRVVYCNLCRFYFKQIDIRELAYAPYLPLEEWTTLHLDLLALKTGWRQPPSPAPAIYSKVE